ncbi:hypothetical protein VD0004_g4408 [Verticillium dahliae]|nr:hypothetical protein VD0004_g4408 [Verticillium dahliae]
MTNYNTIADGNASSSTSGSADEMNRSRRKAREGGGQASMLSSIINLLNTIVGAGTLAMPSVLSHMGIVLGSLMIVWSGLTAAMGLYLQGRCARYLDRGSSSFFAISKLTYPNAAVLFDAAIAVKCFGVGVSYMIIIGDLMPKVILGFNSNTPELHPYLTDRNFWITAFMFLVIPLAFLRRLDSLKYTSIVALVSIGYLVILVVYHFGAQPLQDKSGLRVIKPQSAVAFLSTLPVVVFAYTCHQNMFSILNEIKDNSPSSVVGVVGFSIGGAASMYLLVAITGYLTFGNDVNGNIVSMCLFYYKISDPESVHHQKLLKEDDDAAELHEDSDIEDSAAMVTSIQSLGSAASVAIDPRKWRKKWRWDLEHLEHDLLRKAGLALAIYGICVMTVCLVMNIVFHASH